MTKRSLERRKDKDALKKLWNNFKNEDWSLERHFTNGNDVYIQTYQTGSSLFIKRGYKLDEIDEEEYNEVQEKEPEGRISLVTVANLITLMKRMDCEEINVHTPESNVLNVQTKYLEATLLPRDDHPEGNSKNEGE